MQGRAGGQDIVDDDVANGRIDGHPVGDNERPRDVLTTLSSAKSGLGFGLLSFAKKPNGFASRNPGRQEVPEPLCLIVAAMPESIGVERYRDEN